jgi:hypothetical protein
MARLLNLTLALAALAGVASAQGGLDSMVDDAMAAPIVEDAPKGDEDLSSQWSDVPFMSDTEFAGFEGKAESRERIAKFRKTRLRYVNFLDDAKDDLKARGVDANDLSRHAALLARLKARYADVIESYGYQLDWPSYTVNELKILHGELRGKMPVRGSFTIAYGGVRAYLDAHATSTSRVALSN